MNLLSGDFITDKTSTLSQATYNDVVTLRQQTETLRIQTERLQSHADRKWRHSLIVKQASRV